MNRDAALAAARRQRAQTDYRFASYLREEARQSKRRAHRRSKVPKRLPIVARAFLQNDPERTGTVHSLDFMRIIDDCVPGMAVADCMALADACVPGYGNAAVGGGQAGPAKAAAGMRAKARDKSCIMDSPVRIRAS